MRNALRCSPPLRGPCRAVAPILEEIAAANAAELATARAQVALHRPVLEAVTRIVDALGASGVDGAKALDRHWRNARTHTLHDPVRWKYQHIGRWVLRGEEPPLHGVI